MAMTRKYVYGMHRTRVPATFLKDFTTKQDLKALMVLYIMRDGKKRTVNQIYNTAGIKKDTGCGYVDSTVFFLMETYNIAVIDWTSKYIHNLTIAESGYDLIMNKLGYFENTDYFKNQILNMLVS